MKLTIKNLTKRYPNGNRALEGLNLELEPGITGLLGPNGAGKTTTLSLLATTSQPSDGEILVDGKPMKQALGDYRRRLGYLPQYFELPALLQVHEALEFFGGLCGISGKKVKARAQELLRDVGLYEVQHRKVRHLSVGMRRRLGIAQALVGDPDVLLVDEPTTGLDPEERNRFRSLLGQLGQSKTVLLSTHIVGDIEAACRNLAVLDEGRLVYEGAPSGFVERARGMAYEIEAEASGIEALSRDYHLASLAERDGAVHARVVARENPPKGAQSVEPTFEEAYLYQFRVSKGLPPGRLSLVSEEHS
jgi:ABC-2 type transport system ATP-binding protein